MGSGGDRRETHERYDGTSVSRGTTKKFCGLSVGKVPERLTPKGKDLTYRGFIIKISKNVKETRNDFIVEYEGTF